MNVAASLPKQCLDKFAPKDQWRCMYFSRAFVSLVGLRMPPIIYIFLPSLTIPHPIPTRTIQSTSSPTSRRPCSSCRASMTTGRYDPHTSKDAIMPLSLSIHVSYTLDTTKRPDDIYRWITTSTAKCSTSRTPASSAPSSKRPSSMPLPAARARGMYAYALCLDDVGIGWEGVLFGKGGDAMPY